MNPEQLRRWGAHFDRHLAAWARRIADDAIKRNPFVFEAAEKLYAKYRSGMAVGTFVLAEDPPSGEI